MLARVATPDEDLEAALAKAASELGLPDYYRDCVRPILRAPKEEWPSCCAGNCDPCNAVLVNVANRVLTLLGRG